MPTLTFEGQAYSLAQGQSVLEALEAAGCEIPHSCRAGACQACLMQTNPNDLPPGAQSGLKDTLVAQGYFLACQCRPQQDLTVRRVAEAAQRVTATVVAHQRLSEQVLRLRLQPAQSLDYHAGQYLMLWRDALLGRSYSLASVPGLDGELLELHIRRVPGGAMSNWLFDSLQLGVQLSFQGPTGNCFYLAGQTDQPLLLMGTGTGLAPLYGIARDALAAGHQGEIHLYHGSTAADGLYLNSELLALTERYRQFHYHPVVREADGADALTRVGELDALALADHGKLANWRVYLCGPEALVQQLRKKCFLAGASMRAIHADAFVMASH